MAFYSISNIISDFTGLHFSTAVSNALGDDVYASTSHIRLAWACFDSQALWRQESTTYTYLISHYYSNGLRDRKDVVAHDLKRFSSLLFADFLVASHHFTLLLMVISCEHETAEVEVSIRYQIALLQCNACMWAESEYHRETRVV